MLSPDSPTQTSHPDPDDGLSFFGRQRRETPELPLGVSRGQVLAGFRLIELIGQGGMGQVWRAEQASVQRKVALKLVRPDRVTEKALNLFAREARAGARFHHAGIVDVIDYGTSDGIAWIAMEFVEGAWTLRDFLNDVAQRDELPENHYRKVALFVAQLADAMEAVHAEGVVHRDLKPQNILISPDQQPKITDFGLARITDEPALSMTGDVVGTYLYMSPEQVQARQERIDHRTDVFSLGIVLYEMLAGRRPFEGDTSHQVTAQIVGQDPPNLRVLRSRIPSDLAVITGKCLEKDLDRRYGSMAELAADIRRYLNHEPIRARPPGRVRKAWLWAQRNPTKSVAGAVAALAFGVISLLFLDNLRTNRELTRTVSERNTAIGSLETANENLSEQTRAATAAALAEKARADEVVRLSALPNYRALMADAKDLWPAHPERIDQFEAWIGRAQALVDELPRHRAKLAELRALAIPQTDEERAAERAAHPDFPRLQVIEGRIVANRRALERRRGGADVELPTLSDEHMALDALAANAIAWSLVDPGREAMGEEPFGLALALRALALAEESGDTALQAQIGGTVAWGFVAMGRDEEAQAASALTLERANYDAKDVFRGYVEALTKLSLRRASAGGLAYAERKLAALEAERSVLAERVNQRQNWRFPAEEDGASARWWLANLATTISALEGLEDPKAGLLSSDPGAISAEHGWSMRRRLVFAKRLRDEWRKGSDFARRWQEAMAAIRSSEKYAGLELVPQTGLQPIGLNPSSGLWEFWHEATGTEPERRSDGELVLTEESGVVLVLIPGGTFWMGSAADAWAAHNPDAQAEDIEGPVHEVELSAYFLSKYELTQAQWLRFAARNPSEFKPPSKMTRSLLHPVEQVSWRDATDVLHQMGLSLPSEAQWENGCRGGTSTPWWTGTDRESLRTPMAANLADRSAARDGATWPSIADRPELGDDSVVHAPVGTYAANRFGLHDVHGNVWEWCLDGFERSFYGKSQGKDPVAQSDGRSGCVVRGGSFAGTAALARSASRRKLAPSEAANDVGIRPARAIDR